MKTKKILLSYKDKKFEINLKFCNWFEKFSGLMFTQREKAKALLFDFKKPKKIAIHSCFVFFPFIALWLDDKNRIVNLKLVRPFTFFIFPKKHFSKLIEIPFNKRYQKIVKLLVGD
jgi:uncharacterized membrane protein (UPF0127 family)